MHAAALNLFPFRFIFKQQPGALDRFQQSAAGGFIENRGAPARAPTTDDGLVMVVYKTQLYRLHGIAGPEAAAAPPPPYHRASGSTRH